jgi:anti-anti-sigma factor
MPSEPQGPALEVERVGDATVVRFTRRTVLDGDTIEAIGAQLLAVAAAGDCRKLVVSFENVESLTSAMLGKLFAAQRKVEAAGGRVAFCKVDPFLLQIFNLVRLPDLVPICADEREALESL